MAVISIHHHSIHTSFHFLISTSLKLTKVSSQADLGPIQVLETHVYLRELHEQVLPRGDVDLVGYEGHFVRYLGSKWGRLCGRFFRGSPKDFVVYKSIVI